MERHDAGVVLASVGIPDSLEGIINDRVDRLAPSQQLALKVASVIGRLQELRDELGLDGIVAELNPGGLIPTELEMRSFELIANEVVPALR